MSAPAVDFLTPYAEGYAQLLAAAGIGLSWQTYGSGDPDDAPIFLAVVPTSPDTIVTLTPIPVGAHPTLSDSAMDLQIRFRAGTDIRTLWSVRDAVRYQLASRFPLRLPTGVHVSSMTFGYGASLGQDDSQRWLWSDLWHTSASDPRDH